MAWGWWWFWRDEFDDIARKLPVKTRKVVGIILLSGGVILSIIGLVPMYLFQDEGSGFGGIGLIGLSIIFIPITVTMICISIPFFRKFEDGGWLEDALFYWSYWFKFARKENRKQQIDCSSCNQKLNIPFSYSGKISCPACDINMELEKGIIQA